MSGVVFVELLSGSIWIGGLVAIAVAARAARSELEPATQVAFFRTLGRGYLPVGGGALGVSLLAGLVLLSRGSWNGEKSASVGVAVALLCVTAAAVQQARGLTRLRRQALTGPKADKAIHQSARRALALRGTIGALTLVELGLASFLAH